MTSAKASVIWLRGCTRCHRVFWVYQDARKMDCSECGHESKNIEWSPVPGFVVPAPRVFLLDESQEGKPTV